MATSISVKLVRGALVLDLASDPYEVSEGFTPPNTLVVPMIAAGTSANRYGGGTLVGRTATTRSFSFALHIGGAAPSEMDVRASVSRLQFMLDGAGDPDYPTYLVYRANTDTTLEPLWGQGALLYEIVQGTVGLSAMYGVSDMKARQLPNTTVDLQIKPYALGRAQLVATATGGILPDQWGTTDGAERGLQVPEATPTGGNKMTNPVFGASTWNTGWTAQASIIASQNTNPTYLLPQTQSSAFLQSSSAATNVFTQSINVGNTNTHSFSALVMRPDGTAVTSADTVINYNTFDLSTTFLSLGNGLYLATASAAGVNAAVITGLRIKSGRSIYLLAFQCEEKSYPTPICWGDLMGCAWTGTAHASTSTRTIAQLKLAVSDTVLRAAQGSIAITVIPNVSSSALGRNAYLFSLGTTNMRATWENANTRWIFLDPTNANQASGPASSFAAGVPVVLHITWGPSGSFIYVNGAQVATNATYTPAALGANLFIGLNATPAENWPGSIADFRTYAYPLTATEVLNDYTNTTKLAGATQDAAQRVGALPWLYTVAGDNIVGAVTGVVNTVAKYNWCAAGGIPGSAPAITSLKLTTSTALANAPIWLSRLLCQYFYQPGITATSAFLNDDYNATADVGNSSGDGFTTVSVTSSDSRTTPFNTLGYRLLQGRECYLFTRLKDAGANLTIALGFRIASLGTTINTDYVAVAADATFRLFKTNPFIFPRLFNVFDDNTPTVAAFWVLNSLRTVFSAANVSVDFVQLMPRPLTKITTLNNATVDTIVAVKGTQARSINSSAQYSDPVTVTGDVFELEPGGYNLIPVLLGEVTLGYTVTFSVTFSSVSVTPRYALL
jgi:hypothetical protein